MATKIGCYVMIHKLRRRVPLVDLSLMITLNRGFATNGQLD
jgi:hypothetical protein